MTNNTPISMFSATNDFTCCPNCLQNSYFNIEIEPIRVTCTCKYEPVSKLMNIELFKPTEFENVTETLLGQIVRQYWDLPIELHNNEIEDYRWNRK